MPKEPELKARDKGVTGPYTHLTLPTRDLVKSPEVAVAVSRKEENFTIGQSQ